MPETTSHLAVLPVLWPIGSAILLAWLGVKGSDLPRRGAVVASAVSAFLSLVILGAVGAQGTLVYHLGGWLPPYGIAVRIDLLAAVMLVMLAGIGFLILLYASKSGHAEMSAGAERWYWVLVLVLLGSMSGLVIAGDLFNMFVMLEISSIAAYGIISVRNRAAALEAAFKYLVLGAMGSGAILMATALVYATTGYLDIAMAGAAMPGVIVLYPRASTAALALYLVGFALKAGLMPLHTWLPDAHSAAPTASSALLSGLVVKVNALSFLKIAYGVWGAAALARTPLPIVLSVFSLLAMIGGSILAWGQTDIKRMLAYSTVSHIGYVFAGIAVGGATALAGSLMHVFNHALLKTTLFLSAGLLVARAGSREISRMQGIGRAMPLATAAFGVAALGMIGIPGTAGFVSKYYLALGALQGGQPILAVAVVVSSLLNGVFYLPIVINAFLRPGAYNPSGPEAPLRARAVLVVLMGLVIWFGVRPQFPVRQLLQAAEQLLLGR